MVHFSMSRTYLTMESLPLCKASTALSTSATDSTDKMLNLKFKKYMSQKGPRVGQGMLDFVEDCRKGVKLH